MANHKSAEKKARQELKRRARNRAGKSTLRTMLKKFRAELAAGSSECKDKLPMAFSLIDKSAKHGFIHRNAADRLKAKLGKQVEALKAS